MADGSGCVLAGCCTFCVVLIVSIFLFAFSFDVIEPTHVGLAYDKNIMHLESNKLYDNGRYLIGLGREFVTFPKVYQTLQFGSTFPKADGGDISVRTREGMTMGLEVSIGFELHWDSPQNLTRLYLDTGGNYRQLYSRYALSVVRDVAAKHALIEFVNDRSVIVAEMREAVDRKLQLVYASCPLLEVVNIEFDQSFADAIEDTEIARQDIEQAQHERTIAEYNAANLESVTRIESQVRIAAARAEAFQVLTTVNASAKALLYRVDREIAAMQALKAKLGFNNTAQLLAYNWIAALQDNKVRQKMVGLDFPAAIKQALMGMNVSAS